MVTPDSMLDRKALRDLWAMRAQALTIALLVTVGVAVFVMSVSNYDTLLRAQQNHYTQERFADAFVSLKRAPLSVAEALRLIDGVGILEPRVVASMRIDQPDSAIPITGRILSIPQEGQPLLNRLILRSGTWIDPIRTDQILVNEAFAESRGIRPGDGLRVILNGRLQHFEVAGIALSPEFVFATRPGDPLPDDRHFVILWAAQKTVATAFDMTGAFNDVVLTIAPGASETHVLAELDHALTGYGGTGAITRRDHASHRFLEDELTEQRTLAVLAPALFFGVAAFLLIIVVGRMVEAQRDQIASLKALGFPTGPILRHYFFFVGVIALAGALSGVIAGHVLAIQVVGSYRHFFRFPAMQHQLEAWVVIAAVSGSLLAALGAVLRSVTRIVLLPAAVAMRAPAPRLRSGAAWMVSGRYWSARRLVALRGIFGRPWRSMMSIIGVGLAMPLVVIGLFWFDALAYMIDMTFYRIQRGDAYVTLNKAVPASSVDAFAALDGALLAEGQRVIPARLRFEHRTYRTAMTGLKTQSELNVPRQSDYRRVAIPQEGLLLSRRLAERLAARIGDVVTIEILEGARPMHEVTLTAISDDVLGMTAMMSVTALNTLMREGPMINAVAIRVDPVNRDVLLRKLSQTPAVATTALKALWLAFFQDRIVGLIRINAIVLTLFGGLIVVGVVYNTARIAFHERVTELASLRILGFTRAEVAGILLTELVVVVVLGIALGIVLSGWVVRLLLSARSTESFAIPPVIAPTTYAIAALAVLATSLASTWVIRKRINHLDLIGVLKARE